MIRGSNGSCFVSRQQSDVSHPKIQELLHQDFFVFSNVQSRFADLDACFFCLGVSSVGINENDYDHLTYNLTLAAATALAGVTAGRLTFCYVSGEGTDSTERGRTMWARIKGKTENALLRLPFKAAYMFRPAYHPAASRHHVEDALVSAGVRRAGVALSHPSQIVPAIRDDHHQHRPRDDPGGRDGITQADSVIRRHQRTGWRDALNRGQRLSASVRPRLRPTYNEHPLRHRGVSTK